MADLLDAEKLELFVYFVLPGVIGILAWDLFVPSQRRDATDLMLKGLAFGMVNALLVLPISERLFPTPMRRHLFAVALLLALPVAEAYALFRLLASRWLRGRGITHPTPTAWDHFFRREKPCWVMLHLKSGSRIAGFYGKNSFASAFPNPPQVYLEQVWVLGEGKKIERSAGAIVSMADCELLEAFTDEEENDGKG